MKRLPLGRAGNERGFATLLVMSLLAIMVVLIVANGLVLRQMQEQLSAIDHQQRARLEKKSDGKKDGLPGKAATTPKTPKPKIKR